MAADEALVEQVRKILSKKNFTEKRMFGGVAFLIKGNMCCGVDEDNLIVRFNPDEHQSFLKRSGFREFDLSSKSSIKGWALVGPSGYREMKKLKTVVDESAEYALSLPAKKAKPKKS